MTVYETLKKYISDRLKLSLELQEKMYADIEKATYITIGGNKIRVDQNTLIKAVQILRDEYHLKVDAIHEEIVTTLAEAEKAAYQEYYAAMPRPTEAEASEIASIVKEYKKSTNMQKAIQFLAQRDFHIKNETVMARPYIFASRELELNDDDFESLLLSFSQEMQAAQSHIELVLDAKRYYEIFKLEARRADVVEGKNRAMSEMDSLALQKHNLESIHLKQRLFELGANPNVDNFTFVD